MTPANPAAPMPVAEIKRRLGRGGVAAIARACGITSQAVSQWAIVPVEHVPMVESATGIARHELRPDYWSSAEAREPMPVCRLRVLSLGAGVQSTTLALMAARGEIKPPDCAVFADTGWEPRAVYEHLDRLTSALPYPVHRVSVGNIRDDIIARHTGRAGRYPSVPFYLRENGRRPGQQRRQCTLYYKIAPIRQFIWQRLGGSGRDVPAYGAAEMLIGISTDEAARMKPSRVRYIRHAWPLVEMGMSRMDCLRWLERAGWSAPKSACIGCPYRSDAHWVALRETAPDEWDDAVAIDRLIRDTGRMRGMRAQQFLHYSAVPLAEVNFASLVDKRQRDLFQNECEGMCGI